LSYDELFNYLDKSFKGDSISNKRDLNELIHSIDYFVFLGVPFDCWYLHMFLHFLGIHELKGRSYHAAVKNRDTKNDMYTYCNDAFKIQFVNKDIKEFVDYVYNHSDISSILRKDTDGPLSGLEKAEEEALQCRFNSCLDLLKSFLDSNCTDNEELIRQYKLIKAEYEVLNSEYMIKKTIGDPYEMGIARIKDILLKLIDKCKDCIKKNSNDGNE
jgi:hypothetical protein